MKIVLIKWNPISLVFDREEIIADTMEFTDKKFTLTSIEYYKVLQEIHVYLSPVRPVFTDVRGGKL